MKSICLIASTLLIVLISQHSTNALPVDHLTTEHPCLEGFESVNGVCTLILSKPETLQKDEPKKFGACPKGKVHGKHGICEDIKLDDQLATTLEPKEAEDTPAEHESKLSHHTDEHEEDVTKLPLDKDEHKEHESKSSHHTDEHEEDVTELSHHTDEHKEHATKLSEDTTESADTNVKSSDSDIPKGCPTGTKPDEQGACQDEVESSSKKPTIDFKDLLSTNGTCPDEMEMLNDKCVYIKSKQSSQSDQVFVLPDDKTKNKEADESVPLPANNVCPEGTGYYSNGLCRKHTRPSVVTIPHSNVPHCGADEIVVDGKCTRKENKLPSSSDDTVKESKSDKSTDEDKKKRHFIDNNL